MDALLMVALLGVRTERIELGTAVVPLSLRVTGALVVTAGFCVHLGTGLASRPARPLAHWP
jgi:hypothetical protein